MSTRPPDPTDCATAGCAERVPLCTLREGQVGVIVEKRLASDENALLQAMGLASNTTVMLCRAGEPCIVAVMTGGRAGGRLHGACCRIGLARPLAEKILVTIERERTPGVRA